MDENNKIEELEKRINDLERLYIRMADNQLQLSSTIKELLGMSDKVFSQIVDIFLRQSKKIFLTVLWSG